jgi:hypothetical protein
MSIGSGSPPGGVGSAGIPGMSGGASGIAGTSGTDSGTTYSAYIAPETFPGVRWAKRPGAQAATGSATLPDVRGSCGSCVSSFGAPL